MKVLDEANFSLDDGSSSDYTTENSTDENEFSSNSENVEVRLPQRRKNPSGKGSKRFKKKDLKSRKSTRGRAINCIRGQSQPELGSESSLKSRKRLKMTNDHSLPKNILKDIPKKSISTHENIEEINSSGFSKDAPEPNMQADIFKNDSLLNSLTEALPGSTESQSTGTDNFNSISTLKNNRGTNFLHEKNYSVSELSTIFEKLEILGRAAINIFLTIKKKFGTKLII